MNNNSYLLVGHIEFLPIDVGFVAPVFECDNALFLQTIDGKNIIESFEPVSNDIVYKPHVSTRRVKVGDKCLFAFKIGEVEFDTYENLVIFFIEHVMSYGFGKKVEDCIYDFIGSNYSPQHLGKPIGFEKDLTVTDLTDYVSRRHDGSVPGKRIKVAIADDHKIFRKGTILSMRPFKYITFVQEADNGQELLDGIEYSQPDIVLMDLRMPVKDGIETTKVIAKKYPAIHILALTMYEDERFVSHMMEIGANGYLLKSAGPDEIKEALTAVTDKGYYLNNFVNRILLKKSHAAKKPTPPVLNTEIMLSDREREVIKYICMEYTTEEISQKLEISPRTVEAIKDRLMERFGAKNTAGLVFFAVKNNLID